MPKQASDIQIKPLDYINLKNNEFIMPNGSDVTIISTQFN